MLTWRRPVSFVNGRVMADDGVASSVRFGSHILGFDERPRSGDAVVDLDGAFVLPGLINAHDHLELNHYGALKRRDRYANATAWIDDLRPALKDDPFIRANQAHSLADRVFIGGLKNLLSGVTTVAHHNPLYRELRRHVPVRVVRHFGWAHSFALESLPVGAHGEPGGRVRDRFLATPTTRPFIVHAGEGVDAAAGDELQRLDQLGCLRANTVLVHGVALTYASWEVMLERRASLIWCPASNEFLFGQTAPVRDLLESGRGASLHIALGTDSRVTGSRDLLDELRTAQASTSIAPRELLRMVTDAAARVLRLETGGALRRNQPSDLIVVPPARDAQATVDGAAMSLLAARRADLACVVMAGRPVKARAGAVFAPAFRARGVGMSDMRVDDTEQLIDASIARRLTRCAIAEPGVSVTRHVPTREVRA